MSWNLPDYPIIIYLYLGGRPTAGWCCGKDELRPSREGSSLPGGDELKGFDQLIWLNHDLSHNNMRPFSLQGDDMISYDNKTCCNDKKTRDWHHQLREVRFCIMWPQSGETSFHYISHHFLLINIFKNISKNLSIPAWPKHPTIFKISKADNTHIRYPDFQPRSSVPRIVVILCFAPADVFKFVPFLSQLFLIVQLVVTTKLL